MGTTTPNIGIYIPVDGEDNYGESFESGMMNVDLHDHSGGPTKGVPISSSGIADGSITASKLNADVYGDGIVNGTGIPIAVNVDNSSLEIVADVVKVKAPLPASFGGTANSSYTNGQLLIGSTAGSTLVKSTLTSGNGISITNGSGSITIAGSDWNGWVPAFARTALNITYTTQIGRYRVDGNMVQFFCFLRVNAVTNAGAGQLTVTGLPIMSANVPDLNASAACGWYDAVSGFVANYYNIGAQMPSNSSDFIVSALTTQGGLALSFDVNAGAGYMFQGSYSR